MILIVWFFFCLMSTFGYTYLFYKINNVDKVSRFSVLLFAIGVVVMTFLKHFNIEYITLLSYFIFYPILFYTIDRSSLKKILVNTFIIGLFGILFDLISMLLVLSFCMIFNVDLDSYYNLFSIFMSILVFFAFIFIGKYNRIRKVLNKIVDFFSNIEYFDYALIIFFFSICILAVSIFSNLEKVKTDILLFIIAFLIVIVFIVLVKLKIGSFENKKFLNTLKENNDFYIKIDDENRIFKHNLMAKLSSIKSVSNKKAISLIDDYVFKTNKNLSYSKKMKSVPYGLNGIIYQKTYPYLENINFKLNNKIGFDIFNVLRPRRYNVLIEKLVLCLDNAIEASLNSKSKLVIINLYDDDNSIYIEIKNSFANTIDVDNLGNLNYSTKGKKRGLGLFSMLRDSEALVGVKVVNNYFISTISTRKQK